jgi:hypothetical protein
MRKRSGIGDVVDGNEIEVGRQIPERSVVIPSYAPESVDADTRGHGASLLDRG